MKVREQYDLWFKQLLNKNFSNLNSNCIETNKRPGNLFDVPDVKAIHYTTPPKDTDAFSLKEVNKTSNPLKKDSGNITIFRFHFDHNLDEYNFKIRAAECIIQSLETIELLTHTKRTDYVYGSAYCTFYRPGNQGNIFRELESGGLELRAYSDFVCKQYIP